jgi:hypothetical protein
MEHFLLCRLSSFQRFSSLSGLFCFFFCEALRWLPFFFPRGDVTLPLYPSLVVLRGLHALEVVLYLVLGAGHLHATWQGVPSGSSSPVTLVHVVLSCLRANGVGLSDPYGIYGISVVRVVVLPCCVRQGLVGRL